MREVQNIPVVLRKPVFWQISMAVRCYCRIISLAAIIALALSGTASANSIPSAVQVAKTVYLENETGNEKVLATASDQFKTWGRFGISTAKDDADLVVVFSHKSGISRWGNVGITQMKVFVQGQKEPVFTAEGALKLLWDRQHPSRACIHAFRKWLEDTN